jgi:hypothetical protein
MIEDLESIKNKGIEKVFPETLKGGVMKVRIVRGQEVKSQETPVSKFFKLIPYVKASKPMKQMIEMLEPEQK